ncbi:MAG: Fic family protein [Acidobacteriia bacterium]|nr:Fic family protein [Terriglobia bacterium]
MSSPEFNVFKVGLFAELDRKKDRILAGKMSLLERVQPLTEEWAMGDCALDGVATVAMPTAVKNHRAATAWLFQHPEDSADISIALKTIHALMVFSLSDQGGQFRSQEGIPLCANHEPCDASMISALVDRLTEWTRADSFGELHPVQQSALVLIRLLDISPFVEATARTSRVVANG